MKPGHQIKQKKFMAQYIKNQNFNNNPNISTVHSEKGIFNKIDSESNSNKIDCDSNKNDNTNQSVLGVSSNSFNNTGIKINPINIHESNYSTANNKNVYQPLDEKELLETGDIPQQNIYEPIEDEYDYLSNNEYTQRSCITNESNTSGVFVDNNEETNQKNYEEQPYEEVYNQKTTESNISVQTNRSKKEVKEFETQCDSRRQFCYNCFSVIKDNVITNPEFKNQTFCSSRCLKFQLLEHSTICKNDDCEKRHFVKFLGILSEGDWFCSKQCLDLVNQADPNSNSRKNLLRKSNYSATILEREEDEDLIGETMRLSLSNEHKRMAKDDEQYDTKQNKYDDESLGDDSFDSLDVDLDVEDIKGYISH